MTLAEKGRRKHLLRARCPQWARLAYFSMRFYDTAIFPHPRDRQRRDRRIRCLKKSDEPGASG